MEDDDEDAVPSGPRVPPGSYTLRLTVDGAQLERPLRVTMDPRVDASAAVLDRQFTIADSIYVQMLSSRKAMAELESVESQLKKLNTDGKNNPPYLAQAIQAALARLQLIKGDDDGDHEKNGKGEVGLAAANAGLGAALQMVESGHRAAPAQSLAIFDEMGKSARAQIAAWQQFKSVELGGVNKALARANRKPLQIAAIEEQVHYAMTR